MSAEIPAELSDAVFGRIAQMSEVRSDAGLMFWIGQVLQRPDDQYVLAVLAAQAGRRCAEIRLAEGWEPLPRNAYIDVGF